MVIWYMNSASTGMKSESVRLWWGGRWMGAVLVLAALAAVAVGQTPYCLLSLNWVGQLCHYNEEMSCFYVYLEDYTPPVDDEYNQAVEDFAYCQFQDLSTLLQRRLFGRDLDMGNLALDWGNVEHNVCLRQPLWRAPVGSFVTMCVCTRGPIPDRVDKCNNQDVRKGGEILVENILEVDLSLGTACQVTRVGEDPTLTYCPGTKCCRVWYAGPAGFTEYKEEFGEVCLPAQECPSPSQLEGRVFCGTRWKYETCFCRNDWKDDILLPCNRERILSTWEEDRERDEDFVYLDELTTTTLVTTTITSTSTTARTTSSTSTTTPSTTTTPAPTLNTTAVNILLVSRANTT